jgi:hypothetical protein
MDKRLRRPWISLKALLVDRFDRAARWSVEATNGRRIGSTEADSPASILFRSAQTRVPE